MILKKARCYNGIIGTERFRSLAYVSGESSGKLLITLYAYVKLLHFYSLTRMCQKSEDRKNMIN